VAEDATGTRYEILDTPANPLVVAIRYGARSQVGGAALPDVLLPGSGYDVVAIGSAEQPTTKKKPEPFGQQGQAPPPARNQN
jgi:hypothetical protein